MAQQSKIFTLPIAGKVIDLSYIAELTPPKGSRCGVFSYGAYKNKSSNEWIGLEDGDFEPMLQAYINYGEFEAKAKKNAFMFGQEVTPTTFIGGILCAFAKKFACGCNDSTAPPNQSEPMTKQPPTDQEPPTGTQD